MWAHPYSLSRSLPFHSLPLLAFSLVYPFPSPLFSLEIGPGNPAIAERCKLSQRGFGRRSREPQSKSSNLVNFSFRICNLVADYAVCL